MLEKGAGDFSSSTSPFVFCLCMCLLLQLGFIDDLLSVNSQGVRHSKTGRPLSFRFTFPEILKC